jgi:hypothetical protein
MVFDQKTFNFFDIWSISINDRFHNKVLKKGNFFLVEAGPGPRPRT